jgi:hypothetical protein
MQPTSASERRIVDYELTMAELRNVG